MVSHANILANLDHFSILDRYREAVSICMRHRIFHMPISRHVRKHAFGARQVNSKVQPARFLLSGPRERVTTLVLCRQWLNLLTQMPEGRRMTMSSLEVLAYGGSPMGRNLSIG